MLEKTERNDLIMALHARGLAPRQIIKELAELHGETLSHQRVYEIIKHRLAGEAPAPMSAEEFVSARRRLGFTPDEMAYALGYRNPGTVGRIERGAIKADGTTAMLVRVLLDQQELPNHLSPAEQRIEARVRALERRVGLLEMGRSVELAPRSAVEPVEAPRNTPARADMAPVGRVQPVGAIDEPSRSASASGKPRKAATEKKG